MRTAAYAFILANFFHVAWLNLVFLLAAVCVGVARVLEKRHYWSDVIAGLVMGLIISSIILFV